jgi:transcriptional regulator with GAF, ATPase, and Fis domain
VKTDCTQRLNKAATGSFARNPVTKRIRITTGPVPRSASTLPSTPVVKSATHRQREPATIVVGHAGDPDDRTTVTVPASGVDLDALERALIVFALEAAGGNRTHAARLLALTRSALLYRMHKHGLVWSGCDAHDGCAGA